MEQEATEVVGVRNQRIRIQNLGVEGFLVDTFEINMTLKMP